MWGRGAQTPSGSDVGLARVVNLAGGWADYRIGKMDTSGIFGLCHIIPSIQNRDVDLIPKYQDTAGRWSTRASADLDADSISEDLGLAIGAPRSARSQAPGSRMGERVTRDQRRKTTELPPIQQPDNVQSNVHRPKTEG